MPLHSLLMCRWSTQKPNTRFYTLVRSFIFPNDITPREWSSHILPPPFVCSIAIISNSLSLIFPVLYRRYHTEEDTYGLICTHIPPSCYAPNVGSRFLVSKGSPQYCTSIGHQGASALFFQKYVGMFLVKCTDVIGLPHGGKWGESENDTEDKWLVGLGNLYGSNARLGNYTGLTALSDTCHHRIASLSPILPPFLFAFGEPRPACDCHKVRWKKSCQRGGKKVSLPRILFVNKAA